MTINLRELHPAIAEHENKLNTCLSYWYPKIKNHVPTPDTIIVHTAIDLVRVLDEHGRRDFSREWYYFIANLKEKARNFAATCHSMPMFLRTGHTSAKHDWKDSCFLPDVESMGRHVSTLVEMSSFAGLPADVWAIREFLHGKQHFICTNFGDMPVVREWRVFVSGKDVLYSAPYWPEDALKQGVPDDPDWREKMSVLNEEAPQAALDLAAKCGQACGGDWSVDVFEAENGLYVTDMAAASLSYGYKPEAYERNNG